MTFIYTRENLIADLNSEIHAKKGMLLDVNRTVNRAVRKVFAGVDIRSARRRAALTPNLYNGIFDYAAPSDLAAHKIIDIPAQAKRADGEFTLVTSEEFATNKRLGDIAVRYFNETRVLQINSAVDSDTIVASQLDSLTSGASDGSSWVLFGDAETLAADGDDFIKGNGSIKWNISSAGGVTAGIQHDSITSIDMTDYFGGASSFFVWAKINSATNLTSYTLRFGSSDSAYYSKTVTAQSDGSAFVTGWNLLRFDVSSLTETGSPDKTDIVHYSIYMTKTTGKVSESDYKFDYLVLKRGVAHETEYYSKFGWQSSAGTWLENSTTDDDVLVADTDEYELIVTHANEIGLREVREIELAKDMRKMYKEEKLEYQKLNPSLAKIFSNEYHRYKEY